MIFDPLYELLNNKKCIVLNKSIEIKKKIKSWSAPWFKFVDSIIFQA